jgi:hypothetical protein
MDHKSNDAFIIIAERVTRKYSVKPGNKSPFYLLTEQPSKLLRATFLHSVALLIFDCTNNKIMVSVDLVS